MAANHRVSPLRLLAHNYAMLKTLPPGSTLLLRRPRTAAVPLYEANLAAMAAGLNLGVEWFEPEPGGREQVFRRDFALVEAADRVEAFFPEDAPMEGGTGHVVEAAMMRGRPVFAWSIDPRGRVDRLGESEPGDWELT